MSIQTKKLLLKISLSILIIGMLCVQSGLASEADWGHNPDFNFTVLLTGGAWYRGVPEGMYSPTTDIINALDGELIEGARVHGKLDFCLWGPLAQSDVTAAKAINADIVITLGQAGSTPALRLEVWGCNTANGSDNDGVEMGYRDKDNNRVYKKIDPDGPDYYEATIDYEKAVQAALAVSVPAYLGSKTEAEMTFVDDDGKEYKEKNWKSSAGAYLCNWAAYQIPNLAKQQGVDFKFCFIHVPTKPEFRSLWMSAGKDPGPSMSIETMIKGIRAIIRSVVLEETKYRIWYTEERPLP